MSLDTSMPTPLPAQPTPTPASTAPPDVAQPDSNNPVAPSSVGSQTQPALPKGSQLNQDPNAVPGTVEPHHSALASIFQDIAGGKRTVYRQTDQGPVAVKENMGPGDMARSIVAAALTGMAAGYAAPHGKGNPKAAAIGAGFNAEAQQKQQTAATQQQQAEEEFKNKQEADEMTLRKMANARDQQESAARLNEYDVHIHQMQQEMAQGKTEASQRQIEFFNKMADNWNALTQAGAKPLAYQNGQPIEEFNSPEEFVDWLHKNPKLAIQQGKYNTVAAVDPNTGKYVIMQKPAGWDDPQWLGMKLDSNGNPQKDKDGNFIPDGTFHDSAGKVVAPAGMISPHQRYDAETRQLELQTKLLTLDEAKERLSATREAHQKDQQLQTANDQWNKANGDADAIDPKTHNFIVDPASRNILKQSFLKDVIDQNNVIMAAQKELDRVGDQDPSAADLKEQISSARSNLRASQINLMKLSRVPNMADVQAQTIRKEFTNDDGTYDEAGAQKSLDSLQINSGLKQSIRARLSSDYGLPSYNPDQIATMANQIASNHKPEEFASIVNGQKMSGASKQALLDQLSKLQKSTDQQAAPVLPGQENVQALRGIASGAADAAKRAGKFVANTPLDLNTVAQ